jgi:hypothetical protein
VNQIDLSAPPPNHKYSVNIEREETAGERKVRLFKDVALFLTALAFVGLIVYVCVDTLHSTTAGADEKKWAMSVLSAAAGGIIGYLVRK